LIHQSLILKRIFTQTHVLDWDGVRNVVSVIFRFILSSIAQFIILLHFGCLPSRICTEKERFTRDSIVSRGWCIDDIGNIKIIVINGELEEQKEKGWGNFVDNKANKKKKKLSYCLVNTIDASWIAILSAVSITTLAVNINKSSLYAEFYWFCYYKARCVCPWPANVTYLATGTQITSLSKYFLHSIWSSCPRMSGQIASF
jgi:hypothetical protein